MSTAYSGGRRSSRVKDLVDLVVLASSRPVDLAELRAAIAAKHATAAMEPLDHFDIPGDWHRTYPATAKGVPSAERYTAATAAALIAEFVGPALEECTGGGTWDPHDLRWQAAHSASSRYPSGTTP
jgi:hypothetical protein